MLTFLGTWWYHETHLLKKGLNCIYIFFTFISFQVSRGVAAMPAMHMVANFIR